jgi:histone-lysine N-methyltransferase SUV39H
MVRVARHAKVETALRYIRGEYVRRLSKLKVERIHLFNTVDASTPSLRPNTSSAKASSARPQRLSKAA